jgi:hypothetical protein
MHRRAYLVAVLVRPISESWTQRRDQLLNSLLEKGLIVVEIRKAKEEGRFLHKQFLFYRFCSNSRILSYIFT